MYIITLSLYIVISVTVQCVACALSHILISVLRYLLIESS